MLGQRIAAAAAVALAACNVVDGKPGMTVTGIVVSSRGGPIPGADVYVGAEPPVRTGADGRFHVSGVAAPYDVIAVLRTTEGWTRVARYEGLTIASPRIAIPATPPGSNAHLSGSLAGYSAVPGHVVRGQACGPLPFNEVAWVTSDGGIEASVSWENAMPESVSLHAIAYASDASGHLTTYDGVWSSGPVAVSPGASVSSVSLVPEPLSAVPVTVSFDGLPAGWVVTYAAPTDRRGDCRVALPELSSPPSSFPYLAPDAASPAFQVALVAQDPVTYAHMNGFVDFALDLGDRAKDFQFGRPVTLLSPEPLAHVSRSTPFTWSASVERPLSVFSAWSDLSFQISVVTEGTAANLAWLPRAGVAMPSAFDGCCDWSVRTHETGTVDDYARLEWTGSVSTDWEVRLPPALASGTVAKSEPRSFFAP